MKVELLVAEEVRPERDNKLTILGLYPGNVIVLTKPKFNIVVAEKALETEPKDLPIGLERVALLLTITDAPEGLHKFKARILDPSGEIFKPDLNLGELTSKKGESHSVIIELKPFVLITLGIYHLEFFVDNDKFQFQIEIRKQALDAS